MDCCEFKRARGCRIDRGPSGTFQRSAQGGESVSAFVPDPLPPKPDLSPTGALQRVFESAVLGLGRLDSVSDFLPETRLFLYSYVRKEAVLSSQIEGTQSSLSDLLLFEMDEAPGVPLDDVTEVSNYVMAIEHGLSRIRGGFPLSNRLIREVHAKLLSRGRGSRRDPGQFRRSQNWIGGTRPGTAVYVPPPPIAVEDCMSELERFLHSREDGLPILIRAGLAHVQFESIHPFLDGNGRVGRLLITLLLCEAGVLRDPLLYLSLYLKRNRATYYELLGLVRHKGDWEAWLEFFLEGVHETAEEAISTTKRLVAILGENRKSLEKLRRGGASAMRLHETLAGHPILSIPQAAHLTGLTFPTVSSAMERLVELGIAREITGKKWKRLFAYGAYMAVLNEGTEPL